METIIKNLQEKKEYYGELTESTVRNAVETHWQLTGEEVAEEDVFAELEEMGLI